MKWRQAKKIIENFDPNNHEINPRSHPGMRRKLEMAIARVCRHLMRLKRHPMSSSSWLWRRAVRWDYRINGSLTEDQLQEILRKQVDKNYRRNIITTIENL